MTDGSVRPISRSKSAGRFGRQQQQQTELSDQQMSSELTVRVKERGPTASVEERPKSRLMSALFRGSGGGTEMAEQKTNELKETLKRPLSSLFRRTQSQHDHNAPTTQISSSNSSSALSPQQQLTRLAPTGRSPIVVSSQQQKGSRTTNLQQGIAIGSGIANGNSPSTAASSVSTTATRPFSGFPGRRPPQITQTDLATYGGQSVDGGEQQQPPVAAESTFNIGLSEQAAIAPQISMRRLSGLSYGSDHNFGTRIGGGGHRGNSGKMGGEIDVNFLSRFLCPEDETSDERIPWNWDSLFANVSSELREEWALEEEANNGEVSVAAGGGMAGELGGPMSIGLNQQQQRGSKTNNG